MAGVFRSSRHAQHPEELGRMASPQIPKLYLEAMEISKNEDGKSDEAWNSRMEGGRGGVLEKGLLEKRPTCGCTKGNLK